MRNTSTTIDPMNPCITLITTYTTTPDTQTQVISALKDATQSFLRHQPGFVSTNIHRSLDGRKVVNYAQWRSRDDFQRMLAHPRAVAHFQTLQALARNDGALFEIVHVETADGDDLAFDVPFARRPRGELGIVREI